MHKPTTIQILRACPHGEAGQVRSDLGYGVMDALVRVGRAKWIDPKRKQTKRREHRDSVDS